MKNWKIAVLWGFVLIGFGLVNRSVNADGTLQPGLINPQGGSEYLYPTTAAPKAGGVIVNDGVSAFRWSNAPVPSVLNASVPLQLIALTSMTLTQVAASTPTTVGQIVFCGNCAAGGGFGAICVSTVTTAPGAGNDFTLSTGTVCK